MAKKIFSSGDCVVAKKWSGEEFLGLYEYCYADGSHCIADVKSNKRFNSHPNDVHLATDEEAIEIKKLAKDNKTGVMKVPKDATISKATDNTDELDAILEATD